MDSLIETLLRCRSKPVTIEFDDGEVVDAVLLSVDPDEHEDLLFDVLSVRVPSADRKYDRRNIYRAPISDVRRIEPLADGSK